MNESKELIKLTEFENEEYPALIAKLMEFINSIKKDDTEKYLSIVDIIIEFCFKYNIEAELIGDAISHDVYFKSFIKKDCEARNIMPGKKPMQDW